VLALIGEEPVLRQRMALGVLQMGGFAVLWTSIAFLLGAAPYGYGEGVIGLFGLAGVAGALVAPRAGRLADRGHGRAALSGFLLAILASWGLLALGGTSLAALVARVVLLDLGIQGAQISNQSAIYALRPEARSRLTTPTWSRSSSAGRSDRSSRRRSTAPRAGAPSACSARRSPPPRSGSGRPPIA
jgi:predicted MFS family arabinose efflux permease